MEQRWREEEEEEEEREKEREESDVVLKELTAVGVGAVIDGMGSDSEGPRSKSKV